MGSFSASVNTLWKSGSPVVSEEEEEEEETEEEEEEGAAQGRGVSPIVGVGSRDGESGGRATAATSFATAEVRFEGVGGEVADEDEVAAE